MAFNANVKLQRSNISEAKSIHTLYKLMGIGAISRKHWTFSAQKRKINCRDGNNTLAERSTNTTEEQTTEQVWTHEVEQIRSLSGSVYRKVIHKLSKIFLFVDFPWILREFSYTKTTLPSLNVLTVCDRTGPQWVVCFAFLYPQIFSNHDFSLASKEKPRHLVITPADIAEKRFTCWIKRKRRDNVKSS